MTKSVGSACAQIAILLTIYGLIHITIASSASNDYYHTADTEPASFNDLTIVRLTKESSQLRQRQRRAAPADVTPSPDLKNQYQSVNANATDTTVTTVDSKAAGSVSYNIHNVGVNGTGQRKDNSDTNTTTTTVLKKPPQLSAAQPIQYPKKVAPSVMVAQQQAPATGSSTTTTTTTSTDRSLVDDVDVPEDVINSGMKNESLEPQTDHHNYYNSSLYVNKDEASQMWTQMRQIPNNSMLSSSHRRAMTVELKFDFPFYGHYLRNVTVATGGFLYTGEYVHSWLAATQYIAPLMANFDTSMSNDSFVRLQDNGTAFTVVWENVTLQDKPKDGKFTFSATLHQSGDIVFGYYQVPTMINTIEDNQHPVKVGLSDAYILDKQLYFARRKTIYEYHRVSFQQQSIANGTIIKLTALSTCLGYNDCDSCINHNTTFSCAWCTTLNRCSTGTDRKKQEWVQRGCLDAALRTSEKCPALGAKGNNAAQENNGVQLSTPSTAATASPVTEPTSSSSTRSPRTSTSDAGDDSNSSSHKNHEHLEMELSRAEADSKSVGVAFGFMVPICLVFAVTLWLFYAYRNPHTKSGQLLIQFRPSQWSWRRGEARYTAATIHM